MQTRKLRRSSIVSQSGCTSTHRKSWTNVKLQYRILAWRSPPNSRLWRSQMFITPVTSKVRSNVRGKHKYRHLRVPNSGGMHSAARQKTPKSVQEHNRVHNARKHEKALRMAFIGKHVNNKIGILIFKNKNVSETILGRKGPC